MLIVLKILFSALKAIYENDMLGSVDGGSKKAGHWLGLEFQEKTLKKNSSYLWQFGLVILGPQRGRGRGVGGKFKANLGNFMRLCL